MTCFELCPICPGTDACDACAAYTHDVIEPFADVPAMPTALADRLRAIEPTPTDREDAAALFAEIAADARQPRPMPAALRRRLRAIPETHADRPRRLRRPPRWLADGGFGLAACALLTTLLTLAAGDVSARFVSTTSAVERTVGEMVTRGEETSWTRRVDESVVRPAGALLGAGLEQVRVGRDGAEGWLGRQLDGLVTSSRETGTTTWSWLRDSAVAAGEQLAEWNAELGDAIALLGADSDSNPDSDSDETNDTDAVPAAAPNDPGSTP